MPRNKIEDLRNHLFETLEALKDETAPMDIERAKAVASVGQVIVNSAMAEVRAYTVLGGNKGDKSSFFQQKQLDSPGK